MTYESLLQAGITAAIAGDLPTAIGRFQAAVAADPDRWEGFYNLGNAWAAQNRISEAIAAYQEALVRAAVPAVYFNLGALWQQQGEREKAQALWEEGWQRFPADRDLGLAVATGRAQNGDPAGAIAVYQTLLGFGEDASVRAAWGLLLQQTGDRAGAIAQLQAGLAQFPTDPDLLTNLGGLFTEEDRAAAALPLLEQAVAIAPNFALAHSNLGTARMALGDREGAIAAWQTASRCDPRLVAPYRNLARAYQVQGQTEAAIAVLSEGYRNTQTTVLGLALADALAQAHRGEAIAVYEQVLTQDPTGCAAYQGLLTMLYQGHWEVERWTLARQWADRYRTHCEATDFWGVHLTRLSLFFQAGDSEAARQELAICQGASSSAPADRRQALAFVSAHLQDDPETTQSLFQQTGAIYTVRSCPRSAQTPPRVGFLSPNWRDHPIGKLVPPILPALGQRAAVFGYLVPRHTRDRYTERIRQVPRVTWREFPADVSPETLATAIAQDQIDVLIELDSHTEPLNLSVLALGAAPQQLSWLGLDAPNLSDRHGALVDGYTHPPTVDALYRETLWRLPHAHIAVGGLGETPIPRAFYRQRWGIDDDTVVYLSPAAGRKLNRETIAAHVQILRDVPHSVLVRKGKGDTAAIARWYAEACDRWQVAPQRIRLVPHTRDEAEHYGYYRAADLVLDSYPYNGGSITLESLWYERPVISLCGRQSFARMGYSFNTAAGLPDTVVSSWEAYIQLAIAAGRDRELRESWQHKLAQGKIAGAPLWNVAGFAEDLWHLLQRIAAQPLKA
ncbi:MAG: tetratricopeptide repeat protein [Pseudanabaenaceae cyanobacterium]